MRNQHTMQNEPSERPKDFLQHCLPSRVTTNFCAAKTTVELQNSLWNTVHASRDTRGSQGPSRWLAAGPLAPQGCNSQLLLLLLCPRRASWPDNISRTMAEESQLKSGQRGYTVKGPSLVPVVAATSAAVCKAPTARVSGMKSALLIAQEGVGWFNTCSSGHTRLKTTKLNIKHPLSPQD